VRLMVTGHRPGRVGHHNEEWVRSRFRVILRRGLKFFGPDLKAASGMALGTDQWWAGEAIELGIPVCAYLPLEPKGWSSWWSKSQAAHFFDLLDGCSEVKLLHDGHWTSNADNIHFFRRNVTMCQESDDQVTVWDGQRSGGTWHALKWWHENIKRRYIWVHPEKRFVRWTETIRAVKKTPPLRPGVQSLFGD